MESLTVMEFVEKFKNEFRNLYGSIPIVSFANMGKEPIIHIDEIELICNVELNKRTNGRYPHGIRTKLRKREIIEFKHVFFYFCDYYGYGPSVSSRHIDCHHATVIYATNTVRDRLEIGDTHVTRVVNEVSKQLQFFFLKKQKAMGVIEGKEVITV